MKKSAERKREWRKKNPGKDAEYLREWNRKNPGRQAKHMREWRKRLRDEVIAHYGSACACCSESEPKFLSIDHINGGGRAHREKIGHGTNFYQWLKREGWPAGFQVLCHNCNFAKGLYGVCPHGQKQS